MKLIQFAFRGIISLIPLILFNGYEECIHDKLIVFYVFVVLMAIGACYEKIKKRKRLQKTAWSDVFMMFFLSAVMISGLVTGFHEPALTGKYDNGMGILFYTAVTVMYFCISFYYRPKRCDLVMAAISFVGMNLFSVIQFFGWDLFDLFQAIPEAERINYLSLLGNTGVYGSYLNLYLPTLIILLCCYKVTCVSHQNDRKNRVFSVAVISGFIGLFCANSDGAYLGLFSLIPLLLILFYRNRISGDMSDNFLRVAVLFGLSGILFGLSNSFFKGMARPLSHLTTVLVKSAFLPILTMILISFCFFKRIQRARTLNHPTENRARKIADIRVHGIQIVFFLLIPVVLTGLFFYFSFIDKNVELGRYENYLRFSDTWGTGRGFVWKRLIKDYYEFSPLHRMVGMGAGSVRDILRQNHMYEMKHVLKYYFDNAHNEYLHYLVTLGVFGLFGYTGLVGSALISAFRSGKGKPDLSTALGAGLLCYLVQATVGVIQPHVSLLVFLFAAVIAAEGKNQ